MRVLYYQTKDTMWFHVASLRVCFMYVVMWNGRVGYNAKNEISGAYFRVVSHIYWTLVTIELTNKKQLSEEVIQGKFYSIGFEQQFMRHSDGFLFLFFSQYRYSGVWNNTGLYLHTLAILNISLNNFAWTRVILCSFWFF